MKTDYPRYVSYEVRSWDQLHVVNTTDTDAQVMFTYLRVERQLRARRGGWITAQPVTPMRYWLWERTEGWLIMDALAKPHVQMSDLLQREEAYEVCELMNNAWRGSRVKKDV